MQDRIGNAHPEGQLGTGDARRTNSNLTPTPYHATDGTASDFHSKRLADTAFRSDFRRTDLNAAQEAEVSTNPGVGYDSQAGSSSKCSNLPPVWCTVSHQTASYAGSLIQRLETSPSDVAKFGAMGDLTAALKAALYGAYNNRIEVARELVEKGLAAIECGRLVVREDDGRLGRPNAFRGITISRAMRDAVIARDGATCRICGLTITTGFDLDHIVPVSEGGRSTLSNLRVTHRRCNRGRKQRERRRAGPRKNQPNLNREVL